MQQTILEITILFEKTLLAFGVLLLFVLLFTLLDKRPRAFSALFGTIRVDNRKKQPRRHAYNKLISTSGQANMRHVAYVVRSQNIRRAIFKNSSTTFRIHDKLVTIPCPVFLGREEADDAVREFAKNASFADIRQITKGTYHVSPSRNMRKFIFTLLRDHDYKPKLSMNCVGGPFAEELFKFTCNVLLLNAGIFPRAGFHFGILEFLYTYPKHGIIRIFPLMMHFLLAMMPVNLMGFVLSVFFHTLWNFYAYHCQMKFSFRTQENLEAAIRVRHQKVDGRHHWLGYFYMLLTLFVDMGEWASFAVTAWIAPAFEEIAKQTATNVGIPFPGFIFGFMEMINYLMWNELATFQNRFPALLMHSFTDCLTFNDAVYFHRTFNAFTYMSLYYPLEVFTYLSIPSMFLCMIMRFSRDNFRANLYRLEKALRFGDYRDKYEKVKAGVLKYDEIEILGFVCEEISYMIFGYLVWVMEFLAKKYYGQVADYRYYLAHFYFRMTIWTLFPFYIATPIHVVGHFLWNHYCRDKKFSVVDLVRKTSLGDVTSLMNMIKTLYDRFVNKQWAAMMLWFADVGLNHINFAFPIEFSESIKGMTLLSDSFEPAVGNFFSVMSDTIFFHSLKKLFTTLMSVKLFGTDGVAKDFIDKFRSRFFGTEESTWNSFVTTAISITSQLSKFATTWDVSVLLERPLASEVRLVQSHLRNNPYSTLSAKENQAALTAASNVMARLDAKPGALTPEEMVGKKLIAEDMEHRLNFLSNDTTREPAFPFVLLGAPGVGKTTIMHDAFNLCSKVAGVEFNPPAIVELQWQQTFPAEARPKGSAHALVYNDGPGDYSNFTEKGLLAFDVIAQTAIDSCALVLPSASIEKKAELHNELKFLFFTSNHMEFKFENNATRLERRLNGGIVCEVSMFKDGSVVPNHEFVSWSQEEQWAHTRFTFGTVQAKNNRMKFVPSDVVLYGTDAIVYMAQRYKIFVDRSRERKAKEDEKCECGMTIKRHMTYVEGELVYKSLTDACAPKREPVIRPHNVFNSVSEAVKQALTQNPRLDSGYQAKERKIFKLNDEGITALSDSASVISLEEKRTEPSDCEDYQDDHDEEEEVDHLPEEVPPVPLPGMTEAGAAVYQEKYLEVVRTQSSIEATQVFQNVAILFVSKWFWSFTLSSYLMFACIGAYVGAVPLYFHLFMVMAGISYQGPLVAQLVAGDDKEEVIERLANSPMVPEFILNMAIYIFLKRKTTTLRQKIDQNASTLLALAASGVLALAFYQWVMDGDKSEDDDKPTNTPQIPKIPVPKKTKKVEQAGNFVFDYDDIIFESDTFEEEDAERDETIIDKTKRARTSFGMFTVPTASNTDLSTMDQFEDMPNYDYPQKEENRTEWQRSVPAVKVSDVGTTLATMPRRVSRNTFKMTVTTVKKKGNVEIDTVHFTWLNQLDAITVSHAFKHIKTNDRGDTIAPDVKYFLVMMEEDRYTKFYPNTDGRFDDIVLKGQIAKVTMPQHKQMNDLTRHLIPYEKPFECSAYWLRRESATVLTKATVQGDDIFASVSNVSDISGTAGDCGMVCWCKVSKGVAIIGVFFGRMADKHVFFYPLRDDDFSVTPQSTVMLDKLRSKITFGPPPDNSLVVTRESKFVELIGTSPVTNKFSSSIMKTPVFSHFEKRISVPLSKPYTTRTVSDGTFHSSWRHSTAQINMNNDGSVSERLEAMRMCWAYYVPEDAQPKARPLKLSEAFFGCESQGIERMAFNTSLGMIMFPEMKGMLYRMRGYRDKYDLFSKIPGSDSYKFNQEAYKELAEMHKILEEGPINVFVEFIHKDEVRPKDKVDVAKVRLFALLDFNYNCLSRMYLLPLIKICEFYFEFMCSNMNAASRAWKDLYEWLKPVCESHVVVDKDGKAFDFSQDASCFAALAKFLYGVGLLVGYTYKEACITEHLVLSLCSKLCTLNGDYFFMTKALTSGWIGTLFCNGMVNISNDIIAAKRLKIDRQYFAAFRTKVMGDDYIARIDLSKIVPGEYTKESAKEKGTKLLMAMTKIQEQLGFVHTSGLKDGPPGLISLEDAVFLKRSFKVHPDLGEVTGALNMDSIWKALCFQSAKAAITPEERLRDVVNMAQRELFLHSKADLERFQDEMDYMPLSQYGWKKIPYEELKNQYLEDKLQMTGF